MNETEKIIKEYKDKENFRYPFDEFWFLEGFNRVEKEILEKIEKKCQECRRFIRSQERYTGEVENILLREFKELKKEIKK